MNQVKMRHGYLGSSHHATGPASPARVSGVDDLAANLDMLNLNGQNGHNTDDQRPESELQRDLDIMFEELARDKLAGVPEIDMPSQFKGVTLFDHQKEGIRWLVHQERSGGTEAPDSPLFRECTKANGQTYWRCKITSRHQGNPPKRIKGGILADDMGLGKTVQTLGLILSNPPKNHVYGKSRQPLGEVHLQEPMCTLIVCPVSVMSNWVSQIESHVEDGALRTALYVGAARSELIPKIKHNKLDVVIVSYDTLRMDYNNSIGLISSTAPKKAKKLQTVFDVNFHRIVLDESHTIRSSNTGYYKSASAVKASTKICLTGTPFVNRPDDIHSLLCFLGLEPLNDKGHFKEWITTPIQQGNKLGLARLRSTMSVIALRRTKKATDIELVGKEHYLKKVSFSDGEHKRIHGVLYETTKIAFDAAVQSKGEEGASAYRLMFELILRIRQACCSGELIPKDRYEAVAMIAHDLEIRGGAISPGEGLKLLNALQVRPFGDLTVDDGSDDKDVKEEVVKPSGRVTRQASKGVGKIMKRVVADLSDDEDDKSELEDSSSEASFEEPDSDDELSLAPTPKRKPRQRKPAPITCSIAQIAPKISALLQVIKEMKPDEKGVIFSQFTSFLNLIEPELEANGYNFTRIDGTMNAAARMEAMRHFSEEDVKESPRFILCSLRAAGTGINLTRGNVVFMLDPWWNKAVESQAMDRVHRLGQTRKVRVYSFAMEGSIEERMIALQLAKAALGKGSMEKLSPKEERRAKLTAMKDLFEISGAEDAIDDWEDDFVAPDDFDDKSADFEDDKGEVVPSEDESADFEHEFDDSEDVSMESDDVSESD